MFRLISFLFVFIVYYSGYSQVYFESNTIINDNITYNKLQEDGFGKKIFSIVGSENNLDVRKISLNLKARLLVRISREPDQKLTATISLTKVNMEGNTTVRDFSIDSLLWPTGFNAKFTLSIGNQKQDVINISGLASGQQLKLEIAEYLITNDEELSATISEIQFNYDEMKFQQLQRLNETISYYYSYGKLLDNLLSNHNKRSVNNNQSVEEIFINKIEVDRVSNYIDNHNFTVILNLKKNDPIEFLKITKRLHLLSKRVSTLTNQQFKASGSSTLNPSEFCKYYDRFSTQYLIEGSLLQPDDASGFREVAVIDVNLGAKDNLSSIIDFYNSNISLEPLEIYQCIFDEFVDIANELILDDNYTDALLLLKNSIVINSWAKFLITQKFNSTIIDAIDGLSSSYLRVGNVAINIQNQEIALIYFAKADEVFVTNQNMIIDINLPDTSFVNYLGLQYEIAMKYIGLNEFELAIDRLNQAKNICSKITNSSACKSIDTALILAHIGNFGSMLENLEGMIVSGQYPDAYEQLMIAKQYKYDNSKYLRDDNRFKELSYSLFLEFLQCGEILIDAEQPEVALDNLLKARSIQQILNQDIIELERLIKLAAEPIIVNLIDQASYRTWANKMEEASYLKQKAVRLNNEYFLGKNDKINQLLTELSLKMQLRYCLSHEIKYSDAITKARILIKNNEFDGLDKLLDEAEFYIVNYPQCNIQIYEVEELRDEYSSVLTFYSKYNDIREKLFNKGYKETIEQYISLLEFYDSNNIFHYDIYFPNLETFIGSQNLLTLTKTTSEYFLENMNLEESLHYIRMFKDQGGNSKIAVNINRGLGKAFGIQDNKLQKPIKESLLEYTLGDKWFSQFKKTYLKNRVNKTVH